MNKRSAWGVLVVAILTIGNLSAQEPSDYRTAFNRAQSGDKPLLVLVTAEWCPPCQIMKKTTIPELKSKDAFSRFHFATVDLGKEEPLARKLIGNRGVPQLIMYEKSEGKWLRRYLRGAQTVQTVEAFVSQAFNVRTASVGSATGK
ncbi:MAG: thioredoxin family protein [Planctomycetota bacterium]